MPMFYLKCTFINHIRIAISFCKYVFLEMVHKPTFVFVVKSRAEEGLGGKECPICISGPQQLLELFHVSRDSLAKGNTETHVATLSYSPASCKPHHSSCEVRFHGSGFCQGRLLTISCSAFNQTISISKWFRPLPGITYDSYSEKTNFCLNQAHMLNTRAALLDTIKLRQFLSFI